ncbi:MAG: hypothetical protein IPQ16_09915 [Geobacteraceae bacterium]|nr:hypothetical protein [Geobacteraceae bacterium]
MKETIEYSNILPEFLRDVVVAADAVKPVLETVSAAGVLWQAHQRRFLLDVPDVARYLVEDGRRVTIDAAVGADVATIERNLCMAPLAALLYQQGKVAFHAAAVGNEHGAILLAGDSGAGKSTLLMELQRRGWTVLADDLTAAELNAGGVISILPTSSTVVLWPDVLKGFGIENSSLPQHDTRRKSFTPVMQDEHHSTYPLRAVYRLGIYRKNDCLLESADASNWFSMLGAIMYNSQIADAQCDRITFMRFASNLSQHVPMSRLKRPWQPWTVSVLADLVEEHLATIQLDPLPG